MLEKLLEAVDTCLPVAVIVPAVAVVGGFLWWLHRQYMGAKDEQLRTKDDHIAYLKTQVEHTTPTTLLEESKVSKQNLEIMMDDMSLLRRNVSQQGQDIASLKEKISEGTPEVPNKE